MDVYNKTTHAMFDKKVKTFIYTKTKIRQARVTNCNTSRSSLDVADNKNARHLKNHKQGGKGFPPDNLTRANQNLWMKEDADGVFILPNYIGSEINVSIPAETSSQAFTTEVAHTGELFIKYNG